MSLVLEPLLPASEAGGCSLTYAEAIAIFEAFARYVDDEGLYETLSFSFYCRGEFVAVGRMRAAANIVANL